MPKSVKVEVPGKLFIAGEYAVTRPGGLAIVAAVAADFSVSIKAAKGLSKMRTNVGLDGFSFKLQDLLRSDMIDLKSDWNFALMAIKKMLEAVGSLKSEVEIEIQSGLGFGKNKKGYGSSAAVVCGIVKALNQFFNLKLSLMEEFKIAADAHVTVQGSGSCGDIAAIIYGGTVFYRNRDLIEPLLLPDWDSYVIATGKSVKTGEKLEASKLSEAFFERSDDIVKKLSIVQSFTDFKQGLLKNQELLRENISGNYVTEKLDLALKAVNSHPRLAGKISGAGFGENLIVFSDAVSQGEISLLMQSLEQKGMKMEVLKIAESAR
ncbi:MAG: phosphomevalonate kinase [Streptococcaceae bacterium]|jgi:phosphomevalonate kinase|nr:phosphomevalonate kinase [Streptococcaceae bacterium]